MIINVFLSTAINGVSEEEYLKVEKTAKELVKNNYPEALTDNDEIKILSNYYCGPAPISVKRRKIHHLEEALHKMKNCDVFVLAREKDGSVKPGCMFELEVWIGSNGPEPIVFNKS